MKSAARSVFTPRDYADLIKAKPSRLFRG